MERKFKQHVKPFKLWESENFSKRNMLNEKTELTDEQLKEYESALFYTKILESGENFAKFAKKINSVKDLWSAIEKTIGDTDGSKSVICKYMMTDFLRIYLKCLNPENDVKLMSETSTYNTPIGYHFSKKSASGTYTEPTIKITSKDPKMEVELSVKSIIDDMSAKLPYINKDVESLLGKLSSDEVQSRIKKNFDTALKSSNASDIVKNIKKIEAEVNKGEDSAMTSVKRTVQNFLGGLGF